MNSQTLTGMSVYLNGELCAEVKAAKLPQIAMQTKEVKSSGACYSRLIKTGKPEPLDIELTLSTWDYSAFSDFLCKGAAANLLIMGETLGDDDGDVGQGYEITMAASFNQISNPDLSNAENEPVEVVISGRLERYLQVRDGVEEFFVDNKGLVFRINGKDQLKTHRERRGLS